MRRLDERELLENEDLDPPTVARAYRESQYTHRLLGNTSAVLRLLRRDCEPSAAPGAPTSRPLHWGWLPIASWTLVAGRARSCLRFAIVWESMGSASIYTPAPADSAVPILTGNAVTDPLPAAHVAVCLLMAHHLTEPELAQLIRDVPRCCDRLILLDPVRHPVPLALFRAFVAPLHCRINALDGQTSIRRAFTVSEMGKIVNQALATGSRPVTRHQHNVGPLWIRQVTDISWKQVATR
jgi:hypothetical protein